MAIKKLLFIDTNIWLDFYRTRSEAGLKLLKHVESVSGYLITNYQLEMEFKKNRQAVILETIGVLKSPTAIPRPGILSDAREMDSVKKDLEGIDKRLTSLKGRLTNALAKPSTSDPVYQACQRMFHSDGPLALTRGNPLRRSIKRRALRRFLLGYPPRKRSDTSMGDAFNWEWRNLSTTLRQLPRRIYCS